MICNTAFAASIVHAVHDIVNTILQNIDNRKFCFGIFFRFKEGS